MQKQVIKTMLKVSYRTSVELGEQCQTPSRVGGTCTGIRNCSVLHSLLEAKPLPSNTLDLLRRSLCGFKGIDPLVCCPSPSLWSDITSTPTYRPPPQTEVTIDVRGHKNIVLLRRHICGPLPEDRNLRRTGNISVPFEFPWMALIAYSDLSGPLFKCGGSIINEHYILTAAHCVKFLPQSLRPISVRLGEHNLDSEIDCVEHLADNVRAGVCAPAPENFDIEEIIPHPNYIGRPDFKNDIALLRLSRAANFSFESVHPICLPIGLPQQTQNLDGKSLVISGWTVTDKLNLSSVLLKAKIPSVSYEECKSAFKDVLSISPVSQVCAGSTRVNTCLGDSGGPIISYNTVLGRLKAVQQGILSFGSRNCDSPGKPTVYTRVGNFMKWILDNIKP